MLEVQLLQKLLRLFFLKKWANPSLFFIYYLLFKPHYYFYND